LSRTRRSREKYWIKERKRGGGAGGGEWLGRTFGVSESGLYNGLFRWRVYK